MFFRKTNRIDLNIKQMIQDKRNYRGIIEDIIVKKNILYLKKIMSNFRKKKNVLKRIIDAIDRESLIKHK